MTGTPKSPSDPHPTDEEHYDRIKEPGGSHPPPGGADIGPNDRAHDGKSPPKPRNVEDEGPRRS